VRGSVTLCSPLILLIDPSANGDPNAGADRPSKYGAKRAANDLSPGHLIARCLRGRLER
jgi:hypothetical protein